jgi:chromosome segregation and condensation protein ScpB
MVRLSTVAVTFRSSTIEGKGLKMSLRNLARAVSGSTMKEHKDHVRKALEKRKKELEQALAAVEAGLAYLGGGGGGAKKSAKRRAKKR